VLSGSVDKYHDNAILTVNDLLVRITSNGLFTKEILLDPGDNIISVSYTNEYNMLTTKEYHITYEAQAAMIHLVQPPQVSHDKSYTINFEVVGEKDTHINTYLNNKLMSANRTVRNGFTDSLIYQTELDYKAGLNEFLITANQSDGRSVSRSFTVDFIPVAPEVNLLNIGYEGEKKYLRLAVTDQYNSVLSAYYGDVEANATGVLKHSDTEYLHYYKIEISDTLEEFTVINQYGKKTTYTVTE